MQTKMIDWLWHLRGSVKLDALASNQGILASIEQMLARQRKPVTARDAVHVKFNDPLWRELMGPNWLAMVIYDQGHFWIEDSNAGKLLRYELRSLHGCIFCACASALFFSLTAMIEGPLIGLKFAAMAFGWLYGMNLVLAFLRVPLLIRRAAAADSPTSS